MSGVQSSGQSRGRAGLECGLASDQQGLEAPLWGSQCCPQWPGDAVLCLASLRWTLNGPHLPLVFCLHLTPFGFPLLWARQFGTARFCEGPRSTTRGGGTSAAGVVVVVCALVCDSVAETSGCLTRPVRLPPRQARETQDGLSREGRFWKDIRQLADGMAAWKLCPGSQIQGESSECPGSDYLATLDR